MSVPRTIEWRPWLTQTILVGVFSGTCLGALMTAWRNRRFERAQLRRDALERMLSQFLAPVSMQLARSKRSSEAYHISYGDKGRSYFHAKLMRGAIHSVASAVKCPSGADRPHGSCRVTDRPLRQVAGTI